MTALSSVAAGAKGLSGATIVLVTDPRPPGLATRLRHRFRAAALATGLEQAAETARRHGAARAIVLSSAFAYDDDCGLPLDPVSPTLTIAMGKTLRSLDDPSWGCYGILFGPSRRITDTTFSDLTGWRPRVASSAESLAALCFLRG